MSVSLADSALWAGLYGDRELSRLLGDAALIRAMIRVEAVMAEGCAAACVIPAEAGHGIAAGLKRARVTPAQLGEAAARDGVPVPGLLAALRKILPREVAPFLHWGATSQDIVDTATVLQLGRALDVIDARLTALIAALGALAEAEAETVMPARTRTQIALPTTFGALVAAWGTPLISSRDRIAALRPRLMRLSLHGAVGTDAALGQAARAVRAHMGAALGLSADDQPWHTARDGMAELGAVLTILCGGLGKIGQDVAGLAQSGIGEVRIAAGGSSTMPHKSNPVVAEALVTLARSCASLQGALFEAVIHGHARDGAAWALEWQSLRQIVVATGAALSRAARLLATLTPERARMAANLSAAGLGPFAEAAVFALARTLPRPQAQAAVEAAFAERDPRAALERDYPQADWAKVFDPLTAAAQAPAQALAFAGRATRIKGRKR